jgi:hypothetical protein
MSAAAVLRAISEVTGSEVSGKVTAGTKRKRSKSAIPSHDKLVTDVRAHLAAQRASEQAAAGRLQQRKPSKRAQEALDKLLKRKR